MAFPPIAERDPFVVRGVDQHYIHPKPSKNYRRKKVVFRDVTM